MSDDDLNELELATASVVKQAACDFAAALAETPQFKAYEEAAERLNHDAEAQRAIEAFETRQQSLQALLMLKAVSEADQIELQRLKRAFNSLPAMVAYTQAQADLMTMCQTTADLLSQAIGLDYAAVCGSGCC